MTKIITNLGELDLKITSNMHLVIYFKELAGDFKAKIQIAASKKLQLEHIILGGNVNCELSFTLEKDAELVLNSGFKLTNNNSLDYSYYAEHLGAESKSDFKLVGSLDGSAKKQSQLKIHFAKGAVGAISSEYEKISLFSDEAKNVAIPMILSDESEAEGHHGFSSSHISEDALDYLQSRGIAFDKIKAELTNNELLKIARLTKQDDIIQDLYRH